MEPASIKYIRLCAKSAVQVGMHIASMEGGRLAACNAVNLEKEGTAFANIANKEAGVNIAEMKMNKVKKYHGDK